ncbi:MAG TPA: nuclear transport factor 2 family protein [Steroidobacteraceae bacterium]|nr:nuclear transport factor 2 family protein [Steroidobacteraceae bacterium]
MAINADTDSERVVLRFFATLSSGDLEAVRQQLHEEATWTPQVRAVPGAGVHKGRRGIVDEFLAPVRGLFRPGDPKVIIDSIASKGPLVFLESHSDGRLADGRPYENLYAWAIEVRDGKIFAIREYFDSHYVMGLFPAGG